MKFKNLLLAVSILCLMAVIAPTPSLAQDTDDEPPTIAAWLQEAEDYTALVELLEATDLITLLEDPDADLTLLAPSDDAFTALLDTLETDLQTLLENGEVIDFTLEEILTVHVIEGAATSDVVAEANELETVQGTVLYPELPAQDDETEVLLYLFDNESRDFETDTAVGVVEADIEASNGVIHVLDGVLLPSAESTEPVEVTCIVSTASAGTARVRVGPGNNRTAVSFLPANQSFDALSQSVDDEGNTWYELNPNEAAPDRLINTAWVAATEVDTEGNCEDLLSSEGTPIIPPSGTSNGGAPASDDDAGTDTDAAPSSGAGLPLSPGTYTLAWNQTVNSSCVGTGNIRSTLNEVFPGGPPLATLGLVASGGGLALSDGTPFTQNPNGQLRAADTVNGVTGTFVLQPTSQNSFNGSFIITFTIDGTSCSSTINFTGSR